MTSIPQGARDVTTVSELADVAAALAKVTEFSVDVEADAMHHFRAKMCFVQIGTDDDVFLIDALALGAEIKGLASVFADPQVIKIIHAADGDLQYLAQAGIRVEGLFDTHRAAVLLGLEKNGLVDLVMEMFGVRLTKEHQKSDFSERPLKPGMREYIANDVRYLTEVGRRVRDHCRTAGIFAEVMHDCARLAARAAPPLDPATLPPPRISAARLEGVSLAAAESIAKDVNRLRLECAAAHDRPYGRILSNKALVEIATDPNMAGAHLWGHAVHQWFRDEHTDEVNSLIYEALGRDAAPLVEEPPVALLSDPAVGLRRDALEEFRKGRAAERGVTPGVVLPTGVLEQIARHPPTCLDDLRTWADLGDKRVDLYGEALVRLLKNM